MDRAEFARSSPFPEGVSARPTAPARQPRPPARPATPGRAAAGPALPNCVVTAPGYHGARTSGEPASPVIEGTDVATELPWCEAIPPLRGDRDETGGAMTKASERRANTTRQRRTRPLALRACWPRGGTKGPQRQVCQPEESPNRERHTGRLDVGER